MRSSPRGRGRTSRRAQAGRRERGYSLRALCVFPRELRRAPLQAFSFVLQTRVPAPGAPELIANLHVQPPQSLDLELDPVAVLERGEAPVVGAGGEHVARIERVDSADPLDAAGNLVRHVARVEILLEYAVHPKPDLQMMRVANLIGGDEVGAHGREAIARFHLV